MKVFFSIFAIYLLGLFLTPCADSYAMEAASPYHHKESEQFTDHNHPERTDMCSPFCLCNCCGAVSGVVFHWDPVRCSEIRPVEVAKPNPPYISFFVPRYIGEIWQPPKING